MNRKWLEFITKNTFGAPDGTTWYTTNAEEILSFLLENNLIKK